MIVFPLQPFRLQFRQRGRPEKMHEVLRALAARQFPKLRRSHDKYSFLSTTRNPLRTLFFCPLYHRAEFCLCVL